VAAVPRPNSPFVHGARELPHVFVDSYNIELRDKDGKFVGDHASSRAFEAIVRDWHKRVCRNGEDLFDKPAAAIRRKELGRLLARGSADVAGLVHSAIEEFAQELAAAIKRFLETKKWRGTECIVVGGGFRESRVGEIAIGRAAVLLKERRVGLELFPTRHDPDEAGLLGALQVVPPELLDGHRAILAADIGGSNIRAGIVHVGSKNGHHDAGARVWDFALWRHRDEDVSRRQAVTRLAGMVRRLIKKAKKARLDLAPLLVVACPGIIADDGTILRGGQNLPGGNWEGERFNLPNALSEMLPRIGKQPIQIIVHNDAVVQGLSEAPFIRRTSRCGIVTIGTGLGNARFTNRRKRKRKSKGKRRT